MLCNGLGRKGNNPRCVKIRAIKPKKPTQHSTSVRGWGKESILKERRSNKNKKKARHRKNTEQQNYAFVFVFIAVFVFSSSYRERRIMLCGEGCLVFLWGDFFCLFVWLRIFVLFFWCGTLLFLFCSNFILFFLFYSNFIPRTMTNLILQLAFGFYSEFLKLNNHRHGNLSFFDCVFVYAIGDERWDDSVSPAHKTHGTVETSPEKGHKFDKKTGACPCEERLRKFGLFSLGNRLCKDLIATIQYLSGAYQENTEGLFIRKCRDRTGVNGLQLRVG